MDGRPFVQRGALGGRAVFLDTGAGKGGHLAWIDLPFPKARLPEAETVAAATEDDLA
jgi:hypothetical protein